MKRCFAFRCVLSSVSLSQRRGITEKELRGLFAHIGNSAGPPEVLAGLLEGALGKCRGLTKQDSPNHVTVIVAGVLEVLEKMGPNSSVQAYENAIRITKRFSSNATETIYDALTRNHPSDTVSAQLHADRLDACTKFVRGEHQEALYSTIMHDAKHCPGCVTLFNAVLRYHNSRNDIPAVKTALVGMKHNGVPRNIETHCIALATCHSLTELRARVFKLLSSKMNSRHRSMLSSAAMNMVAQFCEEPFRYKEVLSFMQRGGARSPRACNILLLSTFSPSELSGAVATVAKLTSQGHITPNAVTWCILIKKVALLQAPYALAEAAYQNALHTGLGSSLPLHIEMLRAILSQRVQAHDKEVPIEGDAKAVFEANKVLACIKTEVRVTSSQKARLAYELHRFCVTPMYSLCEVRLREFLER